MYGHHLCLLLHSDWDTSKTWFLNASTASSGNENRWQRISFKNVWADVWEHGEKWFVFSCSNFSEDFRQINCGVPLRIDRPTMLKWNSRYMTSFAEETGHHLLRSNFSTNNFRWLWHGFKDPHGGLLLCIGPNKDLGSSMHSCRYNPRRKL